METEAEEVFEVVEEAEVEEEAEGEVAEVAIVKVVEEDPNNNNNHLLSINKSKVEVMNKKVMETTTTVITMLSMAMSSIMMKEATMVLLKTNTLSNKNLRHSTKSNLKLQIRSTNLRNLHKDTDKFTQASNKRKRRSHICLCSRLNSNLREPINNLFSSNSLVMINMRENMLNYMGMNME